MDLTAVYRPVSVALIRAAVVSLLLIVVLGAVWAFGMVTWFSVAHQDPTLNSASRRQPPLP